MTGDPVVVYCLAHAGGDARAFAAWGPRLPDTVLVRPVQLPGHGERLREPLARTMSDAVDHVLDAVDPTRPHAFFGHSLGAVIAFETRLRLHAAGAPAPDALLVSGHRAPHLPLREPRVHDLDDDTLAGRLRELAATPVELLDNPGFLRMVLPVLRADLAIAETYHRASAPPLPEPLVAVGGREDPDVSGDELEAWAPYTSGGFRTARLPGGHFYLTDHPELVLAELAGALDRTACG